MCLRCDTLLLHPGFVLAVALEGDGLTRRSSRPLHPCLCKGAHSLAPAEEARLRFRSWSLHCLVIIDPKSLAPRVSHLVRAWAMSQPRGRSGGSHRTSPCPHLGRGHPPATKQNPLSIPETAALGGALPRLTTGS